jgi:hypothetical protein
MNVAKVSRLSIVFGHTEVPSARAQPWEYCPGMDCFIDRKVLRTLNLKTSVDRYPR